MPSIGFIGGSSPSISPTGDCQRTVNWIPETLSSSGYSGKEAIYPTPKGKSRMAMFPAPGLKNWVTLPDGRPRAMLFSVGTSKRLFVVGGQKLYEIPVNSDGSAGAPVVRSGSSVLVDDGLPASMAVSQIELCVAAGGLVFILNLANNVFTAIPQASFQGGLVSQVGFADSYFIALLTNSAKFQISGLLAGTTWAGADIFQVEKFPDNIVTMIVDHGEIMLGGVTKSTAYQSSTDPNSPFAVNLAAQIIECGSAASFCRDRADNSVFWLGSDERGGRIAYRLQGYIPTRISTHEIENHWRTFPTVSDAVSYAWEMNGHMFWQIYFPSAKVNPAGFPTQGETWVYDVSTGLWFERDFRDSHGTRQAHRSWCHVFAYDKHLVGDWNDNKIYEMDMPKFNGSTWDFADDFGNPIIRDRVGPHIASEGQWIPWNSVAIDCEMGLGPVPALTTDGLAVAADNSNARDPIVTLMLSDDSGRTWAITRDLGIGQAGKFKNRAIARMLGQSRDRVPRLTSSDSVPVRIMDVFLNAQGV